MKEIFSIVQDTPLFRGIGGEDFDQVLSCMGGVLREYPKGGWIWLAGDSIQTLGIVLEGTVQVFREEISGKRNLLVELEPGELFGEVFACAGVGESPVSVFAVDNAKILHLEYRKMTRICPSTCPHHQQLLENMLMLLAQKNLMLHQKIEILSRRTIRERLLCYFEQQGKKELVISLNREELAEFLCVERSALSAELSKMQQEGILVYKRNYFHFP